MLLPVEPSHGDYYEAGATKVFFNRVRVDANMFRRDVNNYADDSQLLSTGISFPTSFQESRSLWRGGKAGNSELGAVLGFASYSYIVGNAWNPVTGGLFLGDDASSALTQTTGYFPDSQDQRNTVRARVHYQAAPRLWFAVGCDYNTGLPFRTGFNSPTICDRIWPSGDQSPEFQS